MILILCSSFDSVSAQMSGMESWCVDVVVFETFETMNA